MTTEIKCVEFPDLVEYRLNGKLHREDGPADAEHRQAMPAVENANGTKEWYIDGKRHRTDGPAVELSSGDKGW